MKSYNSRSDAGKNVDGYDSIDELLGDRKVEDIDDLLKDSEDESDAKSIRGSPPKPKNLKDLSEKSGILGYTAPTSLEIERRFAKPIIKMSFPFKCTSCPYQFLARNDLKDHEKTDHFLFSKSDEMKHKQGKDKKDQLHKRMENKRDFEKRFNGRSEKSQRQEEKERSWKKFISREREHERVVKGRH